MKLRYSTDYLLGGSLVVKNGRIDKFLFDGGYAQASPTGATTDNFILNYYNRDHLGNNREVIGTRGAVRQVTNYYPFGTPFTETADIINPDAQPYKYNGKELDRMHGLDTYDYGARQYYPILGRWDRMDPLCEKYYGISPYAYCANNPINAIDEEGRLTIFINGFHFGDGGNSAYWENEFDIKIMQHFHETRSPLYYDGSTGGLLGLLPMSTGNQVSVTFHSGMHKSSSYFAGSRYNMGYKEGEIAAASIFSSLSRDGDGKINEVIRIVSHSMGGAFAKGFAQALMDYILNHPNLTNGASLVEYDFAPYQPEDQEAVKGVDTYQYSHHYDGIAYDRKIKGAHYNISYDKDKGHSISDFISYISQLPEGEYEVVNGQIVRK